MTMSSRQQRTSCSLLRNTSGPIKPATSFTCTQGPGMPRPLLGLGHLLFQEAGEAVFPRLVNDHVGPQALAVGEIRPLAGFKIEAVLPGPLLGVRQHLLQTDIEDIVDRRAADDVAGEAVHQGTDIGLVVRKDEVAQLSHGHGPDSGAGRGVEVRSDRRIQGISEQGMGVDIARPGIQQEPARPLAGYTVGLADADNPVALLESIRRTDDPAIHLPVETALDPADVGEEVFSMQDGGNAYGLVAGRGGGRRFASVRREENCHGGHRSKKAELPTGQAGRRIGSFVRILMP